MNSVSWNRASLAILARHSYNGHPDNLTWQPGLLLSTLQASLVPLLTAQLLDADQKFHSGTPWQPEFIALPLLVHLSHSMCQNPPAGLPKHITWIGFCSVHTSTKPRHDCICGFFFPLLRFRFLRLAFHTSLPYDHGWL